MMTRCDIMADCQAKTGTVCFGADKRLANHCDLFGGHSGAIIGYGENDFIFARVGANGDFAFGFHRF